ncbi:MAG: hypothetical protein IIW10_03945 [Spirochaetaceae bacterium]|nr:hypothetical protein [Spirochaetaceae bacterium]
MKIFNWDALPNCEEYFSRGCGLSVGLFDGVHLGHQMIFQKLLDYREKNPEIPVGVLTFRNLPQKNGEKITTFEKKMEFFEKISLDFIIPIDNFEKIGIMKGADFFSELKKKCNLAFLVVGEDFRCGKNRDFGMTEIADFAQKNNFLCEFLPEFTLDGLPCRSSVIRDLLKKNHVALANKMLGKFREEQKWH